MRPFTKASWPWCHSYQRGCTYKYSSNSSTCFQAVSISTEILTVFWGVFWWWWKNGLRPGECHLFIYFSIHLLHAPRTCNHDGSVMNQKADIHIRGSQEGWVWELLSAFRLILAEMFGGRRYWQEIGGVYKGCCFPRDTWRVCFPATVCWKSFHRVQRQTEQQRWHSRPQTGTYLISQVLKDLFFLCYRWNA